MPVQVSYPGVYIQEVPSGVRPITAVPTSIAAFIGYFSQGPLDEATEINGMGDFLRIFGPIHKESEAGYAVEQFYTNGGGKAYVVRVAAKGSGSTELNKAKVKLVDTAGVDLMDVEAANEGAWGNALRLSITHPTTTTFDLVVNRYFNDAPTSKVQTSERYVGLSSDSDNERYFLRVINAESQLVHVPKDYRVDTTTVVLPAAAGTLGTAVSTTSGELAALNNKNFKVVVGGTDFVATIDFAGATVASPADLRPRLESAIRGAQNGGGPSPALDAATVALINGRFQIRETPGGRDYDPTHEFDIDTGTPAADAANRTHLGLLNEVVSDQEFVLQGGANGEAPTAAELIGDPNPDDPKGMYALTKVDLFNVLCIPRAAELSAAEMTSVISKAMTLCDEERAFLLIDMPDSQNTPQKASDWIDANAGFRSPSTATFFPRVRVPDRNDGNRLRSIGPSGTMAGIFAKVDTMRGVWKAPAGIEAQLRGVSELGFSSKTLNLTDAENGSLNPIAINCLRRFPIHGPVAWGSRTLQGADAIGSEWKYIPIRRLALMIEESLYRGTKWVVFEPNDEPLWAKIRQNVTAFMLRLHRQGAFAGASPDDAFYVKCDAETTTPTDQNLGIVNVEVGFAPLKPAEFVVIKIQQIAQAS